MSDQILVPYDGSPPSENALEYAFETFPDADVTALYVIPLPDGYWEVFAETEDRIPETDEGDEYGQNILSEATEIASEHGRDLETEIDTGTPARVIVDRASAYDTVVIGSHGREGVSRILLGSVAENVVRRAPVPVLVVR